MQEQVQTAKVVCVNTLALVAAWLDVLSNGLTILATAAAFTYTCFKMYELPAFQRFIAKWRKQ